MEMQNSFTNENEKLLVQKLGQPKWAPNLEFTKFEFSVKF